MTKFIVTTYAPMPKREYRARLHGDTVPTVEAKHEVEATDPVEAIKMFPDYMGPEVTSKSQFMTDAHSQIDPRTGVTGVYAVKA